MANLVSNNTVRLQWNSVAGHGYRVHGSANAANWSPFSDWLRATNANAAFTLPPRTNGAPYLFRVEVTP